ncbi:MAG: cation-translocating P-type ATPase [Acidobacteriaceae bacterium]
MTSWHSLTVDQVFAQLDSHPEGITEQQAGERMKHYGGNVLQKRKTVPPLMLLARQFANYFILVLLFAAGLAYGVSYIPGQEDRKLTAYFILGIILLSVLLSFFEEYRSQRELEALSRLLVFRTAVLRQGVRIEIDASQVVPGDILALAQGQKVPADARIFEAHSLRADESTLTGESLGVDKTVEPVDSKTILAERVCMVYGSTFITHGRGLAVVVSTGSQSEVGQIATSLGSMAERPTPFQVEVHKMARQMTLIIAALAAIVAIILYFVLHEPLIDVALNTLSLAVATIPESLPIVLSFALALGARQMARQGAVVRNLSVVESLGSVDTVCTDKTGTLTQNRMQVKQLYAGGRLVDLGNDGHLDHVVRELLRTAILCNEASFEAGDSASFLGDPVDTALLKAGQEAGLDIDQVRNAHPLVNMIPFSSERKLMTTLHQQDGKVVAFTKGAPGIVLAHCTACEQDGQDTALTEDQRLEVSQAIQNLQSKGMYVLGMATKHIHSGEAAEQVEQDMTFIGLLVLMDPPRPQAAEAIAIARVAGIRVVMITGDNGLTAQAVAAELGIGQNVVDARHMDGLSNSELFEEVKEVDIIARATPQVKQVVLQELQNAGHFVAMTGDGVNDATALKQSDVGIAMGMRGTDIAKESAQMVLLDDNFATIVLAIREGRRIFDNIRKFTNYLLSTSLGEVFVVLMLSIAGYFPLSAIMLLWVNVVTDLVPASALAADPAVNHVMKRRPRRHDEPIMNKAIYATIAGSIFRTLIAYGLIFWVGLHLGGLVYARTMLFTAIVLHAFTRVMVVRQLDNLSIWSNPALLVSYAVAVGLQLLALYTPLRNLFGVVPLDWRAWLVMVPVTAGSSFFGVYMTRWILKLIPLWAEEGSAV